MGVIYWQPGDISSREFGLHALDLEASIDGQTTKSIALDRKAHRQRVGSHTGAPNNGGRRNSLSRIKRDALRVNGGHRNAVARLNAKRLEGLGDHRPRAFAHVRTDPSVTIGENDAERRNKISGRRLADRRAGLSKHLSCDLNACEAAAHYEHVILAGLNRTRWQPGDMIVEPRGALERVDVESLCRKPRNWGPSQAAAKSEHEPIISQVLKCAPNFASDLSTGDVNVGDLRYDELNANRA